MASLNRLAWYCLALGASFAAPAVVRAADAADCHAGTYRLVDGALVDVAPDDGDTLRWRQFDGTTGVLHPSADGVWNSTRGWTVRADGITATFSPCPGEQITFGGVSGQRVALDVKEATFISHGTVLAGRLVMPKGAQQVPIVVLLHGSEQSSALADASLQTYFLQHLLPAEGVGAFVYDKRGTGKSAGQYTQDYSLLADDAVAALREAQQLAGARLGRIGYQGGSQGGWVAPLAANRTAVDFVIVCFGLAVNVIDEDQEAVELQMREKGYPPEVIAKALEVASAAEDVFENDFKGGFEKLDAVRAKYGSAPWYKDVQGDFAFFVLQQHSDAQLRALAPKFDWHTPFHYDPMPALRANKVPQLWILGGEDYQAPSAETSRRIRSLVKDGLPFTLAYYPAAEHGMTLFETGAGGERVSTRYAPGYIKMIRDFARDGTLQGSYGDAEVTKGPRSPRHAP
ncbi:MAG TPA: alpha/beta hydrolase [Steroidobacteraceae bacterium]|nr:alpha/beta hydrolase [Steroidobacteraceae bacterium]